MPFSEVSEVVRNRALVSGARTWLDGLPSLVADLEREWSITVGRPYTSGTEAFVAEATLPTGEVAVLKLLMLSDSAMTDRDGARREIAVLRLADGEGCARLFQSDAARGAMLMERLGPSLFDLGIPIAQRHEVLCAASQRLWRPAPDANLPTGADKARWLMEFIVRTWEEMGRPCSEQAVAYALACAERRLAAHDDERAVLVHGDVHQWNALQSADGFKLVDPDGLLAEAEYDMGILMREDPVELIQASNPFDRASWLAARTGLDATAIWEWGVVERVSTGLACERIDLQPFARQTLEAAEVVASGAS